MSAQLLTRHGYQQLLLCQDLRLKIFLQLTIGLLPTIKCIAG